MTGEPISADQAERAGLVSHVVDPDKLMPKAMEIAGRIAALSKPIGMRFFSCPLVTYETVCVFVRFFL